MGKKCLLIMPALFSGGAEKQYRYIIDQLEDTGHEITVLLVSKPLQSNLALTKEFIATHKGIEFIQLSGDVPNANKKNKYMAKFEKIRSAAILYGWLKKYLSANAVDIVMFSYVTELMLTPLFNKYGTRVIFNERNTGRQICDSPLKIKNLKKCHKVVSNSKFAAEYIENKTGIKVRVINNGIELARIEHKEHEDFNIVVPARITPIKNQLMVVEAIERLAKAYEIKLYLAGSVKDEAYLQRIRKYIEEKDLQNAVILTGHLANMQELYQIADLIVLPSFEEGTPNVLLEAYMYGIDVLASDIPMNRDCCVNSEDLFDVNNCAELSQKIVDRYNTKDDNNIAALEAKFQYVKSNYSLSSLKINYSNLLFGD